MKNTQRTHEEHEEREEQRISKKAHSQRFIVILFQQSSIHPLTKLKDILCSNQNYITTIPIKKSFMEIESEDHFFCNFKELYHIIINTNLHL